MSTSKSTPEQLQELVRLVAKTPARRRYVLLRRASGELAFVQDEIDAIFEQEIAAAFGKPKPRRRVIKIDLSRARPAGSRAEKTNNITHSKE